MINGIIKLLIIMILINIKIFDLYHWIIKKEIK